MLNVKSYIESHMYKELTKMECTYFDTALL